MIKQIRGFVGFILQPDLKLRKIVPDPTIKLTLQSSLRYDPSVIIVFYSQSGAATLNRSGDCRRFPQPGRIGYVSSKQCVDGT